MGMISAICWIPKGAAKNIPFVDEPPTQEEMDEAIKSLSLHRIHDCDCDGDVDVDVDNDVVQEEEEEDVVQAKSEADAVVHAKGMANALRKDPVNSFDSIAASLRELDMENYDNEEDGPKIFGTGSELYYPTNDMDPYLKHANDMDDQDAEDDEEIEDKTVKPSDMIIVTLHNNDSYNYLEAVILEELDDGDLHMFPYHEIPLNQFPLCLAWSNSGLKDGQKGNFVAVGTMGPEIEIWDFDIVDCFEPHVVLGGKSKNTKGKNKKVVTYREGSHRDSILGIAWNTEYKNVLASASTDRTIKIWDVAVGKCVTTLDHHNSKVQAVVWSPWSSEMILSGSFDKSVVLKDVKNCVPDCIRWSVEANVETLAWDPHNEHSFVVSLENGTVKAFDKRRASSSQNSSLAMFTLHAHEKAVSSISFGPCAPNFLATASLDKTVKLWDLSNNHPSCIASLNPKVGAIFSVSFSNDSHFLLAVGGSKGNVKVWNTITESLVATKYGSCGVHTTKCPMKSNVTSLSNGALQRPKMYMLSHVTSLSLFL